MTTVGVSGPSGCGKSLLCSMLSEALPNSCLLQQDWYFRDPDEVDPLGNFCEPQYLKWDEFLADVQRLRRGEAVTLPVMDSGFRRSEELVTVEPRDIVIVEGMTIFRNRELLNMCDVSVYLDPGLSALKRRKWRRDRSERNKSTSEIRRQLVWVEREYRFDLNALPTNVVRLDNSTSPALVLSAVLDRVRVHCGDEMA